MAVAAVLPNSGRGKEGRGRKGRWEGRGVEGRGGEGYTKAVYQNIDCSHYTDPSVGRAYHLVFHKNTGTDETDWPFGSNLQHPAINKSPPNRVSIQHSNHYDNITLISRDRSHRRC